MSSERSLIGESDFEHLPPIVKKYLVYTGTVGKEKILNVRVKFDGRIRSKVEDSWMRFTSEQYNFFDSPTRLFYIKAYKMGIPALGIHIYKEEVAIMKIKLAGLLTLVDAKGPEMNQGETVTFFNDMCCMAPPTLIDKSIKWEIVDPLTVKAYYTNGNITISATLYFNIDGALLNFISNDRFETTDGKIYKNYPWSTPIRDFADFGGIIAPTFATAIYSRPDSDFCYGEFNLKEIEYNCMEYKDPS
jgi:hypothetical protein